jgi:hypothetical protein
MQQPKITRNAFEVISIPGGDKCVGIKAYATIKAKFDLIKRNFEKMKVATEQKMQGASDKGKLEADC